VVDIVVVSITVLDENEAKVGNARGEIYEGFDSLKQSAYKLSDAGLPYTL